MAVMLSLPKHLCRFVASVLITPEVEMLRRRLRSPLDARNAQHDVLLIGLRYSLYTFRFEITFFGSW